VFDLLLAAAGEPPVQARDDEADDTTPAALDAVWESAPAFDGCTSGRSPAAAEQPIHLVRRTA
jgi:hypothetical protein